MRLPAAFLVLLVVGCGQSDPIRQVWFENRRDAVVYVLLYPGNRPGIGVTLVVPATSSRYIGDIGEPGQEIAVATQDCEEIGRFLSGDDGRTLVVVGDAIEVRRGDAAPGSDATTPPEASRTRDCWP